MMKRGVAEQSDSLDETADGAISADTCAARWAALGAALRERDRALWAIVAEGIDVLLRHTDPPR